MVKKLLIVLISTLAFLSLSAQSYRFKKYSVEEFGVYPYIYCIQQDSKGFLWVGTGDGLYRFDGLRFRLFSVEDSLSDNFVSACSMTKAGTGYIGHNNGTVSYFNGNYFQKVKLPVTDIGSVTDIITDESGVTWISSLNGGLIKIDKPGNATHFPMPFDGIQVYAIAYWKSEMVIGTSQGIGFMSTAPGSKIQWLEGGPETKIECLHKLNSEPGFMAGTEDEGVWNIRWDDKTKSFISSKVFQEFALDKYPVKEVVEDKSGNLWFATMGGGLWFVTYSREQHSYLQPVNYNSANGLGSADIQSLFYDREGNIWIGTYGNGLEIFLEDYFSFFLQDVSTAGITAIYPSKDELWVGGREVIASILYDSPGETKVKESLPGKQVSALYTDYTGRLWIGTEKQGLYYFEKNKLAAWELGEDLLINEISGIDGFGENLFVGTHNGLVVINRQSGESKLITTTEGLPHNFVTHVLSDLQMNVWIATPTNYLALLKDGKIEKVKISEYDEPVKVNSLAFDPQGKLWIATYGNGVYYREKGEMKSLTKAEGLLSDFCYSISSDESGVLWVGHRQGVSSIAGNIIRIYSKNRGIFSDFNPNAAIGDPRGILWLGTTSGLLRYDHRKNKANNVAPGLVITSLRFNEREVLPYELDVQPYDAYKLRIDFTGITFREPELVTYTYKLEGYDRDWSEPSHNPYAMYPKVEDGDYVFMVKARNSDGVESESPVTIRISISPPIWKRWWFILLSALIVLYVFYLFVKIRERNHRKMEETLKRMLDERTREVVAQKEEIERKNKDITDSINYAQRIQEAILPVKESLTAVFPDSFIYYAPRDIVSGDFYLVHSSGNKVIIVCADATGHGVPGAFVSMISVTIIKDILNRGQFNGPAEILYNLDHEICQIFNQADQKTRTTDGLDISVCEIDTESGLLTFSSAMRPILMISNESFVYVRGSKHSIGMSRHSDHKIFDEHKIQLTAGDLIYLFSDGFPDQFGGDKGKKLKISGLKDWVWSLRKLPMDEQESRLREMFQTWKGEKAQVDDVLMIGLRYDANKKPV